jgi:hypothetical protein
VVGTPGIEPANHELELRLSYANLAGVERFYYIDLFSGIFNMRLIKFIIVWLMIVGISMNMVWIMLFTTGSVDEEHFSFVFHLAAEAITAFIANIVSISLLQKREWASTSMFLSLGLITSASAGAGGFYIFEHGEIMFFLVLEAFAIVTVVLFLLCYFNNSVNVHSINDTSWKKFTKLVNFGLGLSSYVILNSAAAFGEDGNWIMAFVHVFSSLLLFYIHYKLVGED